MDKVIKFMMVNKLYIADEGSRCANPDCDSKDLESTDGWEADGNWVAKPIRCNECHSTWVDVYTLNNIADFEQGGSNE